MQSALLGVITPELRAVTIRLSQNKDLHIHFYYEGEVAEDLIELWHCAITETLADLTFEYVTDNLIERLDFPKPIPCAGKYAYLRREEMASRPQTFIAREIAHFQKTVDLFLHPLTGQEIETSWRAIHRMQGSSISFPARAPEEILGTDFPLAYGRLALQRGLLSVVTPDLRAVVVDVHKEEKLLCIYFYYDGVIVSEDLSVAEYAITKTWADFGIEYRLDTKIERLDYPAAIPLQERYVYLRKESPMNSKI